MARIRRNKILTVYQDRQEVGRLERAVNGAIEFQYSPVWIENEDTMPISISLPIREEPYRGAEASFFFDNLLPDDDQIRAKIAARVRAESDKPFDLLYAIGHDCVGSLQFIPKGEELPKAALEKSAPMKPAQIASLIRGLGFFPLGMEPDVTDFRLSIAGAQEKTALLKIKGKWYKPHGITPTTHILKPPMDVLHNGIDLSTSVENEWLCLQICKHLGLEVTKCEMAKFDDQKCLLVERFDRKWKSPSRLLRIPQEDMCQALGYPSTKRYQADGGPGMTQILELLNASDERAKDRAEFLRAQIVFHLLAATDGHAKNFSIFLTREGFRLTPIYDVMTVFPAAAKNQIQIQKAKMAMSVSGHYKPNEVVRRHFEAAAKESGFPAKELARIFEELEFQVDQLETAIKLPKRFPEEIFAVTLKGITKQASRLMKDLRRG